MNRPMQPGDCIGVMVERHPSREVHDYLAEHLRVHGWRQKAFMTNDPRMLAALRLLGYETVARVRVWGVETFARAGAAVGSPR